MGHINDRFDALARKRKQQQFRAQFDDSGAKIIHIDSAIGTAPGEISSKSIREQLPTDSSEIVVRIHSEGGAVFESFCVFDLLAAYPGKKRCEVSSIALSAGSLLLCAFNDVSVTENSHVMLHNPHMEDADTSQSDRALLGSLGERMVEIYAKRTRKPSSEIRRLMQAETWMNATEAVRFGIADRVIDPAKRVAAKATPKRIVAKATPQPSATARWKEKIEAKVAAGTPRAAAIMKVNQENPGLRQRMLDEVNGR